MEITKSIFTINDYGNIEICLKEVMESKNINRNQLARASNTRFDVVNKWYNNQVEKMDLDVLARFCYILDCQPSDIIKYK